MPLAGFFAKLYVFDAAIKAGLMPLVVVGALVFSLVDSFFVYAEWAGTGITPAMDMGYVIANLLFACAALVAKDAYRIS